MHSMRGIVGTSGRWLWVPLLLVSLSCAALQEDRGEKRYVGAGVGAVVGAGIGVVAGGDLKAAVAGAAVGGTAGFGLGWLADHYEVRRVRDDAAIEEVYGAAQINGPPAVHGYRSWVDPEAIRTGTEAGWVSTFDIQVPAGTEVTVVEERVFVDPDGNTISRRTYDYSHDITGSGGYEFQLTIPVPENAPEGKYYYKTRLLVGDTEASHLDGSFQIARGGRQREMVVACAQ
jgi:hypothetical protein